jgi:hypothetical protein
LVMEDGMLTGNGENNGLFWRKNGDRDAFIWVLTLTWRKSTQNPVFWRQFSVFNTLKIPAPTIEYSHREGFRGHVFYF